MINDQRFVTIADFTDLLTAEFYQSLLEEHGVQAFVPSANAASLRPSLPAALFGLRARISLKVPAHDAERALNILQDFDERAEHTDEREHGDAEPGPVRDD